MINIIDELRDITKKIINTKEEYEKCCNDDSLDIETKKINLNNITSSYNNLIIIRDVMLENYMSISMEG